VALMEVVMFEVMMVLAEDRHERLVGCEVVAGVAWRPSLAHGGCTLTRF
jgi:hypothetical protein